MAKGKISAKQNEILDFIKSEILTRGYPPSVREICQAVNLKSTASVHAHLSSLEAAGYIRRDPSKPRTIEIVDDDFNLQRREITNVPIVGQVAAGEPLLAEQNIRDYLPVPMDMLPNEQSFILRVKGESMTGAGILDGDYVIVKQKNTANEGDMIVALVEDSATVKYFYRDKQKGCFRLQPDNPDFDPIYVKDLTILGEVIGVYRFY